MVKRSFVSLQPTKFTLEATIWVVIAQLFGAKAGSVAIYRLSITTGGDNAVIIGLTNTRITAVVKGCNEGSIGSWINYRLGGLLGELGIVSVRVAFRVESLVSLA